MRRDPRAYLWDAREAASAVAEFTRGKSFEDYAQDRLLRSAVERQFEIIGEALAQFARALPDRAGSIPDLPQIVSFRNLLIHGYAVIDDALVWRTVQERVPELTATLNQLLGDEGPAPT